MTSDPTRLLEDPSAVASLRGDLLHCAQAQVQGLDMASGLAQLQLTTATTAATATGAGMSAVAKLGVGAAMTIGAVALWAGLREPSPTLPSSTTAEVVATAAPTVDAVAGSRELAPPPAVIAVPQTEPPVVSPVPTVAVVDEVPEVTPSEEPQAVPSEPEAVPSKPKAVSATASSKRGSSRKSASHAPPLSSHDVVAEAVLVSKARTNLAKNPARALSLVEEAERTFPHGQLVEERQAIAIRALVGLGRTDEASRRAEQFLARFGRSAHAASVRRAVGLDH